MGTSVPAGAAAGWGWVAIGLANGSMFGYRGCGKAAYIGAPVAAADVVSGSGTGIFVANGEIGTGVTEALCVAPPCDWPCPPFWGGVVLRLPAIGAPDGPGVFVGTVAVVVMMPPVPGVCGIGGGMSMDAPPTVDGTGV